MAQLFASQFPQNINTDLIYDTVKQYYRPIKDTDFTGGSAGGVDAFGRQRVSNPEAIFSSKQSFDNQPLYWDDIQESGSGTSSTYSSNTASTTLAVSANTAGKRTRQTFMRFNYQPGKAQSIMITGILKNSGGGTGITSRLGYFDDNNGLFFERAINTVYVVRRSKTSGTAQDDRISQSNWNIDPMDGSGPSGVVLDFSKTQIFVIDFEWLGVGRIRMGFNVDGVTYYCHHIYNANNLTEVYMSSPNLPLRYQIENSGTGVASSLKCICAAVFSEGGQEEIGTNLYVNTGNTAITCTKAQNNAVLGIRLKDGYEGMTIDSLDVSVLVTTNDNFEWQLIMNPTIGDGVTFNDVSNSSIQKFVGNGTTNTAVSGVAIAGGYGSQTQQIVGETLKSLYKLGTSITGRKDQLILTVRPLGTNDAGVFASLNYREYT